MIRVSCSSTVPSPLAIQSIGPPSSLAGDVRPGLVTRRAEHPSVKQNHRHACTAELATNNLTNGN
jgi:hypothetical protein